MEPSLLWASPAPCLCPSTCDQVGLNLVIHLARTGQLGCRTGSGLLPGGFLTLNAISAHSGYLTKPHRPTDIDFSQFGKPDGPDQGPHSWLPVWPTPGLADSRPPSCHVLLWPFLRVHSWAEGAHSLRPLLTGALMCGVGPTCMTSSSPDHLPEMPPGTGTLGVRASTEEFWGDTVQSTANPKPLPSVPRDSPTGITPPQDLCVPHLGAEGARAGFSGGSQWVCTLALLYLYGLGVLLAPP